MSSLPQSSDNQEKKDEFSREAYESIMRHALGLASSSYQDTGYLTEYPPSHAGRVVYPSASFTSLSPMLPYYNMLSNVSMYPASVPDGYDNYGRLSLQMAHYPYTSTNQRPNPSLAPVISSFERNDQRNPSDSPKFRFSVPNSIKEYEMHLDERNVSASNHHVPSKEPKETSTSLTRTSFSIPAKEQPTMASMVKPLQTEEDLPRIADEKIINGLYIRKIDRFEIINEKGKLETIITLRD
jgi:hypothetical protein